MKWLIRIALVLVLLVVVAAVAGVIMIDSIATAAVQEGTHYATQTEVECEKVDVKLFGSSAQITGLDIKNPDGPFREKFDSFMKVGSGSAEVSAGSVLSDKVVIPRVELSDIEISLVGIEGEKNYEAILESIKRLKSQSPSEAEDEKQVVIKELVIRNITVNYSFDEDPALQAIQTDGTIVIADKEPMVLKDVGSGGVPLSQISADIIADILIQVSANLTGDLAGHAIGLTNSLVEELGVDQVLDTLSELGITDFDLEEQFEKMKELGGEVGEQAGEWIEQGGEALKALGGLLGEDQDANDQDPSNNTNDGDKPADRLRDLIGD